MKVWGRAWVVKEDLEFEIFHAWRGVCMIMGLECETSGKKGWGVVTHSEWYILVILTLGCLKGADI